MNKPVLAYHLIFGAYGFWLPNDPRGSWSHFVGSWELFHAAGKATKTEETRSVAHRPHDRSLRLAGKVALKRPPVKFTGIQARAVGQGFATAVSKSKLTFWACSILPEHVHAVVARSHLDIEQVANLLKGEATKQLISEGIHPFKDRASNGKIPKCWSRGEWSVFLDEPDDIQRSIRYVENNPLKDGKKRQTWSFVVPYRS